MRLKILTFILFSALSVLYAGSEHSCGFDARFINENAPSWPFERYGKLFNVDPATQHFTFIKNAVYDKEDIKKIVGRAHNCVHWSDRSVFLKTKSAKDFSDIKIPVVVKFTTANANEFKKATEGKDFAARTAIVMTSLENAGVVKTGENEVAGTFTPNSATAGLLQFNKKAVKVTMIRRSAKIVFESRVNATILKEGFWSARISGTEENGKFVALRIELTQLPDPREGDDPQLPRLLVIGDSVSMNYEKAAKGALKGVVNYHRNEGNSFSTYYGKEYADYWLGDYTKKGQHWDVIHFNHGLHDLKQPGPGAPFATPIEKYKINLKRIIEVLKKSGAKLIFCTTTPVPNSSGGRYGRQKGAEVVFNKAALEVLKEYPEIQINDLCKVVNESGIFDNFRKGRDVHFYKAVEQKVLGDAVAAAVKKAVEFKK